MSDLVHVVVFSLIKTGAAKKIRKPKPWKHPQPITKTQLMQLRDEFWDTAPHYGGRKGIPLNLSLLRLFFKPYKSAYKL